VGAPLKGCKRTEPDSQDELLRNEDWRFQVIGKLSTGLNMFATEERLPCGLVGFGLPSAPALYISMAFNAQRQRIATDVSTLFDRHPPPQGTWPENHTPLFDYIEMAMTEIICSYSAIEAAADEMVPEPFVVPGIAVDPLPPAGGSRRVRQKSRVEPDLGRTRLKLGAADGEGRQAQKLGLARYLPFGHCSPPHPMPEKGHAVAMLNMALTGQPQGIEIRFNASPRSLCFSASWEYISRYRGVSASCATRA
jgi:hypothetical protein